MELEQLLDIPTGNEPVAELCHKLEVVEMMLKGFHGEIAEGSETLALLSILHDFSSDAFIRSKDPCVRLNTGNCLIQLLKLSSSRLHCFEEVNLQTLLMFLISNISMLQNPNAACFDMCLDYVRSLQTNKTLSTIHCIDDLAFVVSWCRELFSGSFNLVKKTTEFARRLLQLLLQTVVSEIVKVDDVEPILNVVYIEILDQVEDPTTYEFIGKLLRACHHDLELPTQQLFINHLQSKGLSSDLAIVSQKFKLMKTLYCACPQLVALSLGGLQDCLEATTLKESHLDLVLALSQMFAEKNSSLGQDCKHLWFCFLHSLRRADKQVQLVGLTEMTTIICNHPELMQSSYKHLMLHCVKKGSSDIVDKVFECLEAFCNSFDVCHIDYVLKVLNDLVAEASVIFRERSLKVVAGILAKILFSPMNFELKIKCNEMMHIINSYYKFGDNRAKSFTQNLYMGYLIPVTLPVEERVLRLLNLWLFMSEDIRAVFHDMQRNSFFFQKRVQEVLKLCTNCDDKQTKSLLYSHVAWLSEKLDRPNSHQDYLALQELFLNLKRKGSYFDRLEVISDPVGYTIENRISAVNDLLGTLKMKKSNLYPVVEQLCSKLTVNHFGKNCFEVLLQWVYHCIINGKTPLRIFCTPHEMATEGLKLMFDTIMPPVKGKMLHYSEQQMNDAIDDVLRGTAVATAAKRHSVPRVTLLYKVRGRTPRKRQMGPQPVLTKEEEGLLVTWITKVAKAGFPITKTELLDSVQHIIKELNRKNPFVDNRPGRTWFTAFLKRHPNISSRIAQNLTSSRASVREESLSRWFEEIYNYLKENKYEDILEQPERVFNLDESAFFLNPKGNKVLCVKGEKNVYQQVNADEKECLTVLVTGNANGNLAPTLVVFKYERVPHELADSVPKHWGIGKSETGWMTAPLFFEFISNIFHPFLVQKKILLPVIVFVDGHASHLTLHTSKFCEDHGIILIALLPNSTHLIQPMDVAVFHVLKEAWKKKVHQWRMRHLNDPTLKKIHFAPLLEETLNEYITPSILRNGFRKCGLVPWNPAAVDTSKIPSVDVDTVVTNRCSSERLRSGKAFLEKYIGEDKLQSFRNSGNEWKGDTHDHSLFLLWKKVNEDCFLHCRLQEDLPANESYSRDCTEQNGENNNEEENEEPCAANDNIMTQNNEDQVSQHHGHEGNGEIEMMEIQSSALDNEAENRPDFEDVPANKGIPSPFKKALFWPEHIQKAGKRRSKEKIPSVVTSKQWQLYHEKKKEVALEKEKQKQERANARKAKQEERESAKKLKLQEKKKKITRRKSKKISLGVSDTEEEEEWVESGSSMDDVSLDHSDSDIIDENEASRSIISEVGKKTNITPTNISHKKGDFVLVSFPGKKKHFKYVCIVQKLYDDGEIEVMALRSCNSQKKSFVRDTKDEVLFSSPHLAFDVSSVDKITEILEASALSDTTCAAWILKVMTVMAMHKSFKNEYPELFGERVLPLLKKYVVNGTAKESKYAVQALAYHLRAERLEILQQLMNVVFEKAGLQDNSYLTLLSAAVYLNAFIPWKVTVSFRNILPQFYQIVFSPQLLRNLLFTKEAVARHKASFENRNLPLTKQVCMNRIFLVQELPTGGIYDKDKIPRYTECLMMAIKAASGVMLTMANWAEDQQKSRNMKQRHCELLTLICLNEMYNSLEAPLRDEDKACLRLTAGMTMLKLCQWPEFWNTVPMESFVALSHLMTDGVTHVRQKLCKKLKRELSAESSSLPVDFLAFFVLALLEEDKDVCEEIKGMLKISVNAKRMVYRHCIYITNGPGCGWERASLRAPRLPTEIVFTSRGGRRRLQRSENRGPRPKRLRTISTADEIHAAVLCVLACTSKCDSFHELVEKKPELLVENSLVVAIFLLAHNPFFSSTSEAPVLYVVENALDTLFNALQEGTQKLSFGMLRALLTQLQSLRSCFMPEIDEVHDKVKVACNMLLNQLDTFRKLHKKHRHEIPILSKYFQVETSSA